MRETGQPEGISNSLGQFSLVCCMTDSKIIILEICIFPNEIILGKKNA